MLKRYIFQFRKGCTFSVLHTLKNKIKSKFNHVKGFPSLTIQESIYADKSAICHCAAKRVDNLVTCKHLFLFELVKLIFLWSEIKASVLTWVKCWNIFNPTSVQNWFCDFTCQIHSYCRCKKKVLFSWNELKP